MSVISQGFENTLTINNVSTVNDYVNKEKRIFNATFVTRAIEVVNDPITGMKESELSLTVTIPCDSESEVIQVKEILFKYRSNQTRFFISTLLVERDAEVRNFNDKQTGQTRNFVGRSDKASTTSLLRGLQFIQNDLRLTQESKGTQK